MPFLFLMLVNAAQAEASASFTCRFQANLVTEEKNEITVELVKPASNVPGTAGLSEACAKHLGKITIPKKDLGFQGQKSFLLERLEWSGLGPDGEVSGVSWAIQPKPAASK